MPRHPRLLPLLLAAAPLAAAGCSREAFRERADKDVQGVITQKNLFPAWPVENWHVYPDPRARFASPSAPDYPAHPGDDYAAWVTAPNPQHPGRGGAGREEGDGYLKLICDWDAQNRAEDAARVAAERKDASRPPGSPSELDPDRPGEYRPNDPANPAAGDEFYAIAGGAATYLRTFDTRLPRYRLRLDQAVELGVLNAREFQDRREDLYLAALPVTLERYGFAAQAFATETAIRETAGSELGGGARQSFWRLESDAGVTRRFATGAELVARLATTLVYDLTSGNPDVAFSNLTLTFVQPLLRGGGFAVALEDLTQSERTLLYAIRSFARFRKIFYVALAAGGDYTNNPYGLQGLAANLGRGVGANLTANAFGYLPTILRGATLENERKNVAALEQFLRLFENLREGGGVGTLQVVRVEQNLLRGRTTVLQSTRQYLDNIDLLKLQLGVPATLPMEFDDGPLRPIRTQLNRFEQVYAQLREVVDSAGVFDPAEPAARYRERWGQLLTRSSLVRGTRFAQQYREWSADLRRATDDDLTARLAALAEQRRKLLDARADRQLNNQPDTAAQVAELDAVDGRIDRVRFEQAVRRYEAQPWLRRPPADRPLAQAVAFRAALEAGILVAIQARNERLDRIRDGWPKLPPICVDGVDLVDAPLDDAYTKVAQTALTNRLDLMNSRAQVVDAWRQVTVRANALQGVLDVGYDLESATPADDNTPFAFAGSRTRHRLTLTYEPPLIRRAERNQYRASLISYQRSRRSLMAFEDNIVTDCRSDLRDVRRLAESYRIQQRAVELAYSQVDNARSTFLAPPDPASPDTAGAVAALTQQLLEAQSSLVQAQNDLYSTYTNYLISRLTLFLDLELLPLDARGLFCDEPAPADGQPAPPGGPDAGPADRPDADPGRRPERLPAPRPAGPPAP